MKQLGESKSKCKRVSIAFASCVGRQLGEWLMKDVGFTEYQVHHKYHKGAVTILQQANPKAKYRLFGWQDLQCATHMGWPIFLLF